VLQRWAAWLLALGLMLGPVYFVLSTYILGEAGESMVLTDRGQRWTLPDGAILRFARTQAYRPVEVNLTPEMNRIGLQLVFEAAAGSRQGDGADDYQADLLQTDQPILQRPLQVSLQPGEKKTVNAGTLEVYYPGAYIFVLEAPLTPHVPLSQVTLNIHRNVHVPLMPLVWLGLAMIAAGLAFYLERWLRQMR
jgi:hypothetical protein